MINDKSNIIVSICCITYNHAPFIRKALDGFLMQEPPAGVSKNEPWYEILIHDDCSMDGTTEIIKEYAAKYPDRIFPLYETENQYSKGHVADIDMYNYKRARGRYIAYCEGDDYWTDAHKLQKQVDFMETHPDYSVCFHRYKNYNVTRKAFVEETSPTLLLQHNGNPEGIDIDMNLYFSDWYTQPLTMLFRVSMYDFRIRDQYHFYRDTHEIFYLLKAGKCRLINFDGGVRNVHKGGIASMISREGQYQVSYNIYSEWYNNDPNVFVRKYYLNTLQWLVDKHARLQGVNQLSLVWTIFRLNGNVIKLLKNTYHVCRYHFLLK